MGGLAEQDPGLNTILEDSKLSGAMGDSQVIYSATKEDRRGRGERLSRGLSSDSNQKGSEE